jgi:hypothetical protein
MQVINVEMQQNLELDMAQKMFLQLKINRHL